MIQVAVMGYGTIGSGVAEVLDINREGICRVVGEEIYVKYILDLREFPGDRNEAKIVHDLSVITEDPEVRIVVETMGGVNPAYEFTRKCLESGKSVVTSNKAVVAAKGTELLQIARDRNLNYLMEASVGGGIPLIRPLTQSLAGETIQEISGILNGTTNYILTKMSREGESFEKALRNAQELGYAERNPEADVEGHDTCRKIAILTALATGKETNFELVHTEGITAITEKDFRYAKKLGMQIKLIGASRIGAEKVSIFVVPMMLEDGNPLYAISDVYNGVMVTGKTLGRVMFYGSGAGKLPTANAVVSDIVEIANGNLARNIPFGWGAEKQSLLPFEDEKFRYFVRFTGSYDEKIGAIRAALGTVQVVTLPEFDGEEFAVLTEKLEESKIARTLAGFEGVLQGIRA